MHSSQSRAALDKAFAKALWTIASPSRIELLRQIQVPKALREIRVTADDEDGHARPLSRQAIRVHLERLMEVGAVVSQKGDREYGETIEYSLNHQALFALAEEFRTLASLRPAAEPQGATIQGGQAGGDAEKPGPCLILVKGLGEGARTDLMPSSNGLQTWTIGRRRGLAVSLDYDPFVSTENTHIVREDSEYHVVDLPGNRNGTTVNFKPLPKGGRRRLRSGDLIGVGRSLILFRL